MLQLRGKLELLTKQTETTGGEADIDAGEGFAIFPSGICSVDRHKNFHTSIVD